MELHVIAVSPCGWLDFRVIAGDYSELGLFKSQLLFKSSWDALVVPSCLLSAPFVLSVSCRTDGN